MILIGLMGASGSGKSTIARALFDSYGFNHLSLAAPAKEIAKSAFNLSDRQVYGDGKNEVDERWGVSPRYILQQLATEAFRGIHPEVWIRNLELRMQGYFRVVVDDLRFPNEAEFVKAKGGLVFKIEPIERPYSLRLQGVESLHSSEQSLTDGWSYQIENNFGLPFEYTIQAVLDRIKEHYGDFEQ